MLTVKSPPEALRTVVEGVKMKLQPWRACTICNVCVWTSADRTRLVPPGLAGTEYVKVALPRSAAAGATVTPLPGGLGVQLHAGPVVTSTEKGDAKGPTGTV